MLHRRAFPAPDALALGLFSAAWEGYEARLSSTVGPLRGPLAGLRLCRRRRRRNNICDNGHLACFPQRVSLLHYVQWRALERPAEGLDAACHSSMAYPCSCHLQ